MNMWKFSRKEPINDLNMEFYIFGIKLEVDGWGSSQRTGVQFWLHVLTSIVRIPKFERYKED